MCLSILGTWHGEKPGEDWSSAQGLESILWSIQSLMSNNPYENEPGYENAKGEDDQRMNNAYCAKVGRVQKQAMSLELIIHRSDTKPCE